MTVIVAFVGADCAVMASDSEVSTDVHSRQEGEKCWTCGGLIMGFSGTSSIRQPLEAVIAKEVAKHFQDAAEIERWSAREVLRNAAGPVLEREYNAFVPTQVGQEPAHVLASALLVIGRDSGGYWLLELDPNNQPSFYTETGFHTIGSGAGAGYLARGLMQAYEPESQSLDLLKLVAYRTVDTCIRVLGPRFGVGGEVHLYSSEASGPFERETKQGCAVLEEGIEQWTTIESESLRQVVLGEAPPEGEAGAAAEVPEPIEDADPEVG